MTWRFGLDSAEIQEKMCRLTDLQMLDDVLTELFAAGSIEEARRSSLRPIPEEIGLHKITWARDPAPKAGHRPQESSGILLCGHGHTEINLFYPELAPPASMPG